MDDYIKATIYANDPTHSYSRLYSQYSMLSLSDYTPEVSYYSFKAELPDVFPSLNFTNILANMDEDHLYNQEIWGDILLNTNKKGQEEFNSDGFKRYLRYTTIQAGMFGLFTVRSPREIIEGYTDPLVLSLT